MVSSYLGKMFGDGSHSLIVRGLPQKYPILRTQGTALLPLPYKIKGFSCLLILTFSLRNNCFGSTTIHCQKNRAQIIYHPFSNLHNKYLASKTK